MSFKKSETELTATVLEKKKISHTKGSKVRFLIGQYDIHYMIQYKVQSRAHSVSVVGAAIDAKV